MRSVSCLFLRRWHILSSWKNLRMDGRCVLKPWLKACTGKTLLSFSLLIWQLFCAVRRIKIFNGFYLAVKLTVIQVWRLLMFSFELLFFFIYLFFSSPLKISQLSHYDDGLWSDKGCFCSLSDDHVKFFCFQVLEHQIKYRWDLQMSMTCYSSKTEYSKYQAASKFNFIYI